jgi:hypothetical protein
LSFCSSALPSSWWRGAIDHETEDNEAKEETSFQKDTSLSSLPSVQFTSGRIMREMPISRWFDRIRQWCSRHHVGGQIILSISASFRQPRAWRLGHEKDLRFSLGVTPFAREWSIND